MNSSVIIPDFASRSSLCPNLGVGGQNYYIPVIWRRDFRASVKWVPSFTAPLLCCSTRRIPTCRVRPVEKESENPTEGEPKTSDDASSNHLSDSINKESYISMRFDGGWLPSFPHVLMASISNILFGYHIGVMNGPITSIAHVLGFEGDPLMEGLVVSIFVAAAFVGSFSASLVADRIGRRRTLQLDALPLIFGALVSAEANSSNEMILGRLLVGLGIGANTVLVPIYISEVSPTKYRGSLGTISQLATCVGIIVALVLGVPCETDSYWWRVMFRIASVMGFVLMVGMQFVVESPRWLAKDGRWEEAKTVISQLWGKSEVESALKDLKDANNLNTSCEEANWSELLTKRHYKAPAIGGTLFILQQFAGINGVLYFSSLTFSDAGISDNIVASIAVGISNFAGAITALYLMEKQGRRSLLVGSYLGMACSMFLLVIPFGAPIDEQMSHFISVFGTLMYVFTFALGAGPITGLIIPELSSTRTRAKTMAFSLCVHWVCNFIIGLFFLDTVEKLGLPVVYTSFGIVSLLAVAFTYSFVIETKGRSLEEIEFLLNATSEQRD
uniref:TSA: Wollemia nobilis Ref_Wollemi_Transcript_1834_2037 transcribed RNA sequence n=1 Tax=Wollemia nobilis TaxID=56998 RepID=A0A0C9SAU7_9CONI